MTGEETDWYESKVREQKATIERLTAELAECRADAERLKTGIKNIRTVIMDPSTPNHIAIERMLTIVRGILK